jgi:conjugative relaxase-like TrwC/TraI family protein
MLTISKPLTANGARDYFKREFSSDYYQKSETVGVWAGEGAQALGLSGDVYEYQFLTVMNGHHPGTGEELVGGSNAAGGKHRAGYDLTFSAPKSVSLQSLIAEDDRVIEAHNRAVTRAMEAIEARARGRADGAWGVETGNLVYAKFRHETSRDLDPQLHTHCVVANMTERDDGRWRALESRTLYQMQALGTAVYRSELAADLERMGYDLDRKGDGAFEIRGISKEQLQHFASRTRQRDEWLRSNGIDPSLATAAQKERAVRESRAAKRQLTRNDMRQEWANRAVSVGYGARALVERSEARAVELTAQARPGIAVADLRAQRTRGAVTYALADLTEREAVFTRHDLEARALARHVGQIDLAGVRAEIGRRHEARELVRLEEAAPHALTTKNMLRLERRTVAMMEDGRGTVEPIASRPAFAGEKGRNLSPDQRQAALGLLQARDRVIGLQAPAGAGKTYTLEAIREEAESEGFRVIGLAPTTGAVHELEKTNIPSRTIASFLQLRPETGSRQVWIVDEAGLMNTRQAHAILERAGAEQARVVFIGDVRQHSGVEAGQPFAYLQAAHMRTATLTEIRRQEEQTLKRAVNLASRGRAAEAVRTLQTMGEARDVTNTEGRKVGRREGAIVAIPDGQERATAVVRDYVDLYNPRRPQDTLMVAPSNAERLQINALARAQFRERGTIEGSDVRVSTLRDRGITGAARTNARNYEAGDVIYYTQGSKALGLTKGSTARVIAVDGEQNLLFVERANGMIVSYDPKRLHGVSVYQEDERLFAKGDRIQFRAPVYVEPTQARQELVDIIEKTNDRNGNGRRVKERVNGWIEKARSERISNGALGTIQEIDREGNARIKLDSGRVYTLDLGTVRHVDHGYAVTSHSSQGKTTRNVLTVIDTEHSRALVNQQQFYVSASRAKEQARIYTNSLKALPGAVERTHEKMSAIDKAPDKVIEQVMDRGPSVDHGIGM